MPGIMEVNNIEKRNFEFILDIEKRKDKPNIMFGHAAIFNKYAKIAYWEERIMPGAFTETIGADDVRALFNHNPDYVLGRNKSGTLKLYEDDKGLAVEINPPDTQFARDLMHLIDRGDISQMSFGFNIIDEKWSHADSDSEPDKRDILKVKLWDVSPVTFPAYTQTDIAVRSYEAWKKQEELSAVPNTPWKLNLLQKRFSLDYEKRR